MKEYLNDIIRGLISSFDNTEKGFSSRKLTGYAIVMCVIAAHIKWMALGNLSNLETILTIDFGFISVIFGLTTFGPKKPIETPEKEAKP